MKKIGLLSIIGCSVSGVAIAAGVDCNTIPTCAEIGYTKTATDCEGKVMLRCPFDITNDNAVFCADGELCSDEFQSESKGINQITDTHGIGSFKNEHNNDSFKFIDTGMYQWNDECHYKGIPSNTIIDIEHTENWFVTCLNNRLYDYDEKLGEFVKCQNVEENQ